MEILGNSPRWTKRRMGEHVQRILVISDDIWWWTTPFKAIKSGQHPNSKTTSKNYHSKDASKWKGNRSRQLPNAPLGHHTMQHQHQCFLSYVQGYLQKNNFTEIEMASSHDLSIAWSWIITWGSSFEETLTSIPLCMAKKYRKWARHNSRPDTRSGQPTTQRSTSPGM